MKRSAEKEMIDDAGSDPALLAGELSNLRRLNRYLNGCRCVRIALRWALRRQRLDRFSLLDVGTGSADIPAAIVAWGQRRGLEARIVGLETDPFTARLAARRTGHLPNITIVRGDGARSPFASGSFDFVAASQVLHHFPDEAIVALLQRWAKIARRGLIVADLVRHPMAYHGIRLLTAMTTNNIMTLTDAPLSVRRALTFREWRRLLARSGIGPVKMFSVFPYRMAAVLSLRGD